MKFKNDEEEVGKEFKGYATEEEIEITEKAVLDNFKEDQLAEAISFDKDDQIYDWFNCRIIKKSEEGRGVQVKFVNDDDKPFEGIQGEPEWTTRVRQRATKVPPELITKSASSNEQLKLFRKLEKEYGFLTDKGFIWYKDRRQRKIICI